VPHTFPEVAFQTGEIVDPDALTGTFQEIAGKLSGRLNEHDISTDTKTKLAVQDEAYYDAHQIKRAASPGFNDAARNAASHFYADLDGDDVAGDDAVAEVADTEGWQALIDLNGTQDMSLTLTTGEDTLVMFAMAQHFGWKGQDEDKAVEINSPLRLQYALRVDGALLDDTITGAAVYPDPPAQQWYRATPAVTTAPPSDDFDYRHIQYIQGTIGISCAAHPTRLTRSLPVVAGSHTVELVARRLPAANYKVDNSYEGATVQVFNRRLFVLRIKGISPHTGDAASVDISAFEDGQIVTAAQVVADGFVKLSTPANALTNGNLERGALRNEHLPSVVYGPAAQPITPGSPTTIFSGEYPGYGINSAAWTVISDGVGQDLAINGPASTGNEWNLATYPGLFVVMANVEVASLVWNPQDDDIRGILILALRVTNAAGTVRVLGETEVCINTHNPDPEASTPTMRPIQTDAPLMWVVDSTQLSAANRHITRVEVVGAVWDGQLGPVAGPGSQIDARTQRGMIYAFALKGVYL
jgi:hypothetical protein